MSTMEYLDALHLGGMECVLFAAAIWLGVAIVAEIRAGAL